MKIDMIIILIVSLLTACEQSVEDFAYEWSKNVREKIIEESHIESDRIEIDSTRQNWQTIIYWNGDQKLREFSYRPIEGDTVLSIFYSANQKFELVRELCQGIERSFEGIRYNGEHLGLAEFKFCNGNIKESGFRLDGNVGVWNEYDENGKLVKSQDFENIKRLNKLRKIEYN